MAHKSPEASRPPEGSPEGSEIPKDAAAEERERSVTLEEEKMEMEERAGTETRQFVADTAAALEAVAKEYGEPPSAKETATAATLDAEARLADARLRAETADPARAELVAIEVRLRKLEARHAEARAAGDTYQMHKLEEALEKETRDWDAMRTAQKKADEEKPRPPEPPRPKRDKVVSLAKWKKEHPKAVEATAQPEAPPPSDTAKAPEAEPLPAAVTEAPSVETASPPDDVAGELAPLLADLPEDKRRAALDNYRGIDESAHGGMTMKAMMAGGRVRVAYRDGTIIEKYADGSASESLMAASPETPGPQETMGDPYANVDLLTLENDAEQLDEELSGLHAGEQNAAARDRIDVIKDNLRSVEKAIAKRNTPEGLTKDIAALRGHIARAESDLNLAPEEERGPYVDMIDKWSDDIATLEERRLAMTEVAEDADVERMTLPDDPRFQEIYEEKSLDYLLAMRPDFADEYALNAAADGTVLRKDGTRTEKFPSEFLAAEEADDVRESSESIFAARYPEDRAKYDRDAEDQALRAA